MNEELSVFLALLAKVGVAAFLANEVRGLILAAPVLYGMYQAGGTLMALWIGFCSLAGIAMSVVVPLIAARKLQRFVQRTAAAAS
jgi:hypothetical protein